MKEIRNSELQIYIFIICNTNGGYPLQKKKVAGF